MQRLVARVDDEVVHAGVIGTKELQARVAQLPPVQLGAARRDGLQVAILVVVRARARVALDDEAAREAHGVVRREWQRLGGAAAACDVSEDGEAHDVGVAQPYLQQRARGAVGRARLERDLDRLLVPGGYGDRQQQRAHGGAAERDVLRGWHGAAKPDPKLVRREAVTAAGRDIGADVEGRAVAQSELRKAMHLWLHHQRAGR